MKLPRGKLLDAKKGGIGVLKDILKDLKSQSMDGYLKVFSNEPMNSIDGILILKNGTVAAIILEEGIKKTFKEEALPSLVKYSSGSNTTLEVHALDPSIILDYYPEARVENFDISALDQYNPVSAPQPEPPQETARQPSGEAPVKKEGSTDVDFHSLFEQTIKKPSGAALGVLSPAQPEPASEPGPSLSPAPQPTSPAPQKTTPESPSGGEGAEVHHEKGWGELIPDLNFSNFVVGENNRFTHAAALAVAENPSSAYNPLFIYGGVGLGKTHLLNAVGNKIKSNNPNAKVVYLSIENFTNELISAIRYDRINEFRDRYRNVDVLLIDDIQFIGGKDSTQEEFFYTFNTLYNAHKQICMASDRLPKDIPRLEARLKSRFEGGLITDIKPPNYETRLAILHRKVDKEKASVSEDVLEFIASHITNNIRELEGALNKIIAYATISNSDITMDLAKEALGDILLNNNHESANDEQPAPFQEKEIGEIDISKLNLGSSYLVEEERLELSIELLHRFMEVDKEIMVIARTNPRTFRENYGLKDVKLLWLTDRESMKEDTITPSMESIAFYIEDFYTRVGDKSVVMLDGLEYLISLHGFQPVQRFIRQVMDITYEYDAIFISPLSPTVLKENELKALEREMIPLTPEVVRAMGTSKSFAEAMNNLAGNDGA